MSLSVDALHDVRLAPKREARVSPPVDEAFVNERKEEVRLVAVVVARVLVPSTERVEEKEAVVPVIAPRLATVA
jgi:hypothetical protein